MAYSLQKTASLTCDPTAKNRVWDFFAESNRTRPANRRQPQQPRRENRPSPTKTASGRPYWPSRDPIEEEGGINLYGFTNNNSINNFDSVGLSVVVTYEKITTRDLSAGQSFSPYPSAAPILTDPNADGVTIIELEIDVVCVCKDSGRPDQYFILKEYKSIKVIARIHLVSEQSISHDIGRNAFAVANEDAHADVLEEWSKDRNLAKDIDNAGRKHSKDGATTGNRHASDELCMTNNRASLFSNSAFKNSMQAAARKSKNLDRNKAHDWSKHKPK